MTAPQQTPETRSSINRRRFLAGTGTTALALSILKPELVFGAGANDKIDIGLIGCGGRGKWIAKLFQNHGGYNITAVADYFQDRVDAAGEQFQVPAASRYSGLSGYRKLLDQKLDAVVIESPPYFHPEQAAAAVDAGKHVYLAKPVAVDVPGCRTVEETGKRATAKKLVFLVDFQTRANKLYQEAAQKIREGEIGKIISAEAAYHCGFTWDHMDQELRKAPNDPEMRLRAWGVDRVLSGDVITEQNIHALDVACWMLDAHPAKAYGTGGRTRDFIGNCWDRFAVIFYYPENVCVSFNSHQSGFGYDDILCRVFGLKGTVDTHYFGSVSVKSKEFHSDAKVGSLYEDGAVTNIASFHASVTGGQCENTTVPASVRSNLTTILGRTAAYKNTMVTWDEMLRADEKFVADLKGLKT
ncbi:MAG TPA: Gfo/Idh/MocA family oxidoreductase [Clostridia bacterium]|nr:Gfo/Idh/MocA family oxidoreductase [Clostridia bacterium]